MAEWISRSYTKSRNSCLAQKLHGNSRIGARVKVSDSVNGRFEYGALNGVNLRILWGEWNFGAGSLGVVSTTAVLFFSALGLWFFIV